MDVVVAGDFSPMNRVESLMEAENHHGFSIRPKGVEDSLFIINFESCVAPEGSSQIKKVGPHLKCSGRSMLFMKHMGVTAVTLANNHILDYGDSGLFNTLRLFHENGIETVGAGANIKEASKVLYLKHNKERLAVINCCEHEFSYAESDKAGASPLNPIVQYYSIQEAKTQADYVIVIVHGGHEFFQLPSPRMIETYRFFIDAGADAVINHHQHCFSGYEYYKGKPIFYGLGNLCFDWPGKESFFYKGYCVKLSFDKVITAELYPYLQCESEPVIEFCEFDGFRSEIERLNHIIQDRTLLEKEVAEYNKSRKDGCDRVMMPYSNRYLKGIALRGFLPKLINDEKKLLLKAYIDCESHRDVLLYYLKNAF